MHSRKSSFYFIALLGTVLLFSVVSTSGSRVTANVGPYSELTRQQDFDADLKQTREAANAAATEEEKVKLWTGLLERHPNNRYAVEIIGSIAGNFFIRESNDPEGGISYAEKYLGAVTDEKLRADGRRTMLRLYRQAKYTEKALALIHEMEKQAELSPDDHLAISETAIGLEEWKIAADHSQKAAETTPEIVRKNSQGRILTDNSVNSTIEGIRRTALPNLGWALANLAEFEKALDVFEDAEKYVTFNYVGVGNNRNLHNYWAATLLKMKSYQAAIDRIIPNAIFEENEEAIAIYKEAWLALGNEENGLEKEIWRTRLAHAPTMKDFTGFAYDGKEVTYEGAKGEVTLLAFWFPT